MINKEVSQNLGKITMSLQTLKKFKTRRCWELAYDKFQTTQIFKPGYNAW